MTGKRTTTAPITTTTARATATTATAGNEQGLQADSVKMNGIKAATTATATITATAAAAGNEQQKALKLTVSK